MNLYNRLRCLLGIGCRRLRSKLGLSPDRRSLPDRRDSVRSETEALGDLTKLRELLKFKASRNPCLDIEIAYDIGPGEHRPKYTFDKETLGT